MDLIKEQILTASGKMIENRKGLFEPRGHAIEFRINAEDPQNDFAPSPGKITRCFVPGGPGVRLDTFINTGSEVSPFYDSLLAKLIIWDSDRKSAIARSVRALDEFKIEGISTTIPFHRRILANKKFIEGQINTHFIEEEFKD